MPLAVWLGLTEHGWKRPAGAALVLLFAGEIAVSGSRGAIIAGFGGALLTGLVLGPTLSAKVALAAGLVVLAGVCVATSRLPHPSSAAAPAVAAGAAAAAVNTRGLNADLRLRLEDELGHPPLGGYRPPVARTLFGSSGRAQAWVGGVRQAARRPLLGYGFGTEDKVFVDRFYAFEGNFVENSYVGTFLQLGAAGVALLIGLFLTLAWNAYRALWRGTGGPAAGAAGVVLVAALIGLSQSGITSVGNIAVASIWICALTLPALAVGRS